jgi:hypothetical protein
MPTLRKLDFSESDWQEIFALGFEPFEITIGEDFTDGQWEAIADMALGKACRVLAGRLGQDRDNKRWAAQLRAIAERIIGATTSGFLPISASQSFLLSVSSIKSLHDICYAVAIEQSKAAETCEEKLSGVWTTEQAARFRTADEIKDRFTTWLDDVSLKPTPNIPAKLRGDMDLVVRQLLGHAFDDIVWEDVADFFLTKASGE